MSATAAKTSKKKKQSNDPTLAPTTGKGAALYITLGIFMLTLGVAFLIAMTNIQESYVLQQLFLMLLGLCGPLCPGLPVLLIWGGAKLIVSSRHRVSARHFFIVAALYWLVLAGYTLITRVPQGSGMSMPYLDYVRNQAQNVFSAALHQAYIQRSSGAGGLLGMLLAYPLSKLLSQNRRRSGINPRG